LIERKAQENSIHRKSRDFVEVKDRKKNSRNENLKKKLEINFTKKLCEVHPKKTRDFFSRDLGSIGQKISRKNSRNVILEKSKSRDFLSIGQPLGRVGTKKIVPTRPPGTSLFSFLVTMTSFMMAFIYMEIYYVIFKKDGSKLLMTSLKNIRVRFVSVWD